MTRNVGTTRPAMPTIVRILAVFPLIHVDSKLCAAQSNIVLYAAALLDGLEVLMTNAINVGFNRRHFFNLNIISWLPDECRVNPDCPLTKACRSEECVDPCQTTSCGENADCQVDYHTPKCVCRQGLQGNPYVRCEKVQCTRDTDCHDSEKCDRLEQKCVPLCQGSPCARGAQCDARNHREQCTCTPPLQGDGYVVCTQRKILNQIYFTTSPLTRPLLTFSCDN